MTGGLVRQEPRSITSAAKTLKGANGRCRGDLPRGSFKSGCWAGYEHEDPVNGLKPFAFRLHQFISPGDTVYATLGSGRQAPYHLERSALSAPRR